MPHASPPHHRRGLALIETEGNDGDESDGGCLVRAIANRTTPRCESCSIGPGVLSPGGTDVDTSSVGVPRPRRGTRAAPRRARTRRRRRRSGGRGRGRRWHGQESPARRGCGDCPQSRHQGRRQRSRSERDRGRARRITRGVVRRSRPAARPRQPFDASCATRATFLAAARPAAATRARSAQVATPDRR